MEAMKTGAFVILPKEMTICENISSVRAEMTIYKKWKEELRHALLTDEESLNLKELNITI